MAGFVGVHEADHETVVAHEVLSDMLRPVLHRGPDGSGFHTEAGFGFGACRLAVVGPDGGNQPMSTEDERYRIVFNGEIYNAPELRTQLESKGHEFRTQCDTEVLLIACREWGTNCVGRLHGMYAFAVWDAKERELFLARDHSGIKPLYVAVDGRRTMFASEAKALLARPELRKGIDVVGYLGGADFGAHFVKSPFLGIVELAPGCTLRCKGDRRSTSRFFSYQPNAEGGRHDPARLIEELGVLLHEAVGLRLRADVPVGLSLSGGIDSAAIAASLVVHGRRDVKSFTVGPEGKETPDSAFAQTVSKYLRLENERVSVRGVDESDIRRVAWLAEGEFDLSFLEKYELAKAAFEDGVRVLLSGQGADEVLTGNYPTYQAFRRTNLLRYLRSEVEASPRGWPRLSPSLLKDAGDELSGWMGRVSEDWWARMSAAQLFREHWRLSTGMLRFEDRMGMGASVEVRLPYLDQRLLAFIASIPEGSRAEVFSSKIILRSAVARLLPRRVAGRPQAGSTASAVPMSRVVLASRSDLAGLLSQEAVEDRGWFEWDQVRAMIEQGDFVALDHVLILHLLDDVFIRNFDSNN